MEVYIKGMEMPTRYEDCFCFRRNAEYDYAYCNISSVNVLGHGNARLDNCPLVPVPPHGRVIEESKVLDIVSAWCPDDDGSVGKDGDLREMLDEIEALPTIIPASEEGE